MAIKDKNGNVYKLRGPNPLTKDMSDWDKDHVKLINLGYKTEIVHDQRSPIRQAEENVTKINEKLNLYEGPEPPKVIPPKDFIEELSEPVVHLPEPPVEVPEPKSADPVQPTFAVDNRIAEILKERGVEYYCAPVIGHKKVVDELYGSHYQTPKYGTSFIFDAVVIDLSDLELQFWCVKSMTKDSVVYRKISQGGERWWRVNQIESKTGGFLCTCGISDVNPDFS